MTEDFMDNEPECIERVTDYFWVAGAFDRIIRSRTQPFVQDEVINSHPSMLEYFAGSVRDTISRLELVGTMQQDRFCADDEHLERQIEKAANQWYKMVFRIGDPEGKDILDDAIGPMHPFLFQVGYEEDIPEGVIADIIPEASRRRLLVRPYTQLPNSNIGKDANGIFERQVQTQRLVEQAEDSHELRHLLDSESEAVDDHIKALEAARLDYGLTSLENLFYDFCLQAKRTRQQSTGLIITPDDENVADLSL